tara:strand:+ start:4681 stop:4959 length:279 start_codon:yes stop_codon:yes gene_type:complete
MDQGKFQIIEVQVAVRSGDAEALLEELTQLARGVGVMVVSGTAREVEEHEWDQIISELPEHELDLTSTVDDETYTPDEEIPNINDDGEIEEE